MKARDLIDVSYDPHVLYHVSPMKFDFPSREQINAAREWSRWHANGVLGLWCSTFPNMCSPFGKHIYRIVLKPEAVCKGLPFRALFNTTSKLETLDEFQPIIDEMRGATDVLYVKDGHDEVGEVIILNFEAIESFEEVFEAKDGAFYLGYAE